MARGWESKGVADQIEARGAQHQAGVRPSAAELDRRAQRERARMARARVLRELAGASHEQHRALLQRALEHLDAELAATN